MPEEKKNSYIGYEYKEITINANQVSMNLDCYENFGWILPYFVFRRVAKMQTEKIQPLMEEKMEEIYEVCEKGHSLL